MKAYRLTISTPTGEMFCGEVGFLSLRGIEGELAIMANHTPFITAVLPCKCKLVFPDETEKMGEMQNGLLTVGENEVTLLSDSFQWI